MYLHVFIGSPKHKRATPIVIETNIEYALKYWSERKRHNPKIQWVLSSNPKLSTYYIG